MTDAPITDGVDISPDSVDLHQSALLAFAHGNYNQSEIAPLAGYAARQLSALRSALTAGAQRIAELEQQLRSQADRTMQLEEQQAKSQGRWNAAGDYR